MVPNMYPGGGYNPMECPERDAAIHFGAYLQLNGMLQILDWSQSPGGIPVGVIQRRDLFEIFNIAYQPRYRTQLVNKPTELLRALKDYGVILPSKRKTKNPQNNIHVVLHPYPEQVRQPGYVPRIRMYVHQSPYNPNRQAANHITNEQECRLCRVSFSVDDKLEHLDSDEHKFRMLYREKRKSFKSAVKSAKIFVEGFENDMDITTDLVVRKDQRFNCKVKVSVEHGYQDTIIHNIIHLNEVDATPTLFHDGENIEVNVTALFQEHGAYIYPLVAKISPAKLVVLKDLIFRVETELMDELAPISPYEPTLKAVIKEMEQGVLLRSEGLSGAKKMVEKVRLGTHDIPEEYNVLLEKKLQRYEGMPQHELDLLNSVLGLLCGLTSYEEALSIVKKTKVPFNQPLDRDNYSDRFQLLLDLEELEQQWQVKQYDRSAQRIQQHGRRFFLKVEDLAEARPSVCRADIVHVKLHAYEEIIYEGRVEEIQEKGIMLMFHTKFTEDWLYAHKPTVDVRFTVNRFSILHMHRALRLLHKHDAQALVFPQPGMAVNKEKPLPQREWVNPLIGANPEQKRAVEKILNRSSGNTPYLVFGPPGTGKTVTLVEAIAQVWHGTQVDGVTKQLVCAPSNAACNNIAERLINTLPPTAKILRLFSLSTEVASVSKILLKHSSYDPESKSFIIPTMSRILSYHIVIVTIVTAGRLVTGGAGGKFQFVYIDECGQASEPEALIAIAGILTTKHEPCSGQLVLAGDPQQLGPVLCSQHAKDFGLGMSLLERLMTQNPLYMKDERGYNNDHLTKLIQNFRSHEHILHIPNELFYDGELQVKGDPKIINMALNWSELPNKKVPLIFHGVQGVDERESNSPSYFNRQEIDRVVMYIQKLMKSGLPKYKVKQEDIGVISPYRKQVQKFRKIFEKLKYKDIRVGSVEEFQGSEKLIIFISTVRSAIALMDEDYRRHLGFLRNPKRFNVSVTRAKALLIIVGNPNVLRHDKSWYQLLEYCRKEGAAVGTAIPDHPPPEYDENEHIFS